MTDIVMDALDKLAIAGGADRPTAFARRFVLDAAHLQAKHHAAELAARDKRIRELEAELAKRELPPLPDAIRQYVERNRGYEPADGIDADLMAFFNTHYTAPVPQWEKDAQVLERGGRITEDVCKAIAARIREAHRDSK